MTEDPGVSADTRAEGVVNTRNTVRIFDMSKLDNAA